MIEIETPTSRPNPTLGVILLAAVLLLSLPGIRVVRADEPNMTPIAPDEYSAFSALPAIAPPASADLQACGDARTLGEAAKRTEREILARIGQRRSGAEAERGRADVILLNNRGYNYGANTGPTAADWLQLERELIEEAD